MSNLQAMAASSKKKACVCYWEKCQYFSSILKKHDPNWAGITKVKPTQTSLISSIQWHLKPSHERIEDITTDYKVARHHWPRQLVVDNYHLEGAATVGIRYFSTMLSKEEAEGYHPWMVEDANSVLSSLQRADQVLSEDDEQRYKGWYVQAPLVSVKELEGYIKRWETATGAASGRVLAGLPAVTPSIRKKIITSAEESPSVLESLLQATKRMSENETYKSPEKTSQSTQPQSASSTASSPGLVPPVDACHQYIRNRYLKAESEDEFRNDQKAQATLDTLRHVHKNYDSIDVTPQLGAATQYLFPCPCFDGNARCDKFCVGPRAYADARFCQSCFAVKRLQDRQERRRELDKGKRDDLSSTINYRYLTEEEKLERLSKQKKEIKKLSSKAEYWKQLAQNENLTMERLSSPVRFHVQKAFSYVKSNKSDSIAAMKIMIQAMLEREVSPNVELNADQVSDIANNVVEFISNKARILSGKGTTVEFSAATMRIALSLWTRSKKAYEEFRDGGTGHIVLPSVSRIKALQKQMRVKEAFNPTVYGWFFDEYVEPDVRNEANITYGHLIFDEMKLKAGIYWNCSDHSVVGFVSSDDKTITVDDELRLLVCGSADSDSDSDEEEPDTAETNGAETEGPEEADDKSENSKTALYVNQFRFRSVFGVIHTSEFFYNSGSLTGDELLEQLLHVTLCYEMIGCRIFGIVSDAGGINARVFKLLRDSKQLPHDSMLDEEYVSFLNPYDLTRRVYMWFCSTHNLKSSRNSLLRSHWKKGKRSFRFGGIDFGWRPIYEIHERDTNSGGKGDTKVLESGAADPDKWEAMNAEYAKGPFKPEPSNTRNNHSPTIVPPKWAHVFSPDSSSVRYTNPTPF